MSKLRLNLLQGELVQQKNWLTINNVIRIWGGFLLLMIICSVYISVDYSTLSDKYQTMNKKYNQLTAKLERFEQIIDNQTVSPNKANQLSSLKFVLQNKQVIHRQLTDQTQVRVSGFANVMTELATYHHPDISLQHVSIVESSVNLYGLAKSAESVPLWLTGFESSDFIAGQQFSQFNLEIQEDGATRFVVSSLINPAVSK